MRIHNYVRPLWRNGPHAVHDAPTSVRAAFDQLFEGRGSRSADADGGDLVRIHRVRPLRLTVAWLQVTVELPLGGTDFSYRRARYLHAIAAVDQHGVPSLTRATATELFASVYGDDLVAGIRSAQRWLQGLEHPADADRGRAVFVGAPAVARPFRVGDRRSGDRTVSTAGSPKPSREPSVEWSRVPSRGSAPEPPHAHARMLRTNGIPRVTAPEQGLGRLPLVAVESRPNELLFAPPSVGPAAAWPAAHAETGAVRSGAADVGADTGVAGAEVAQATDRVGDAAVESPFDRSADRFAAATFGGAADLAPEEAAFGSTADDAPADHRADGRPGDVGAGEDRHADSGVADVSPTAWPTLDTPVPAAADRPAVSSSDGTSDRRAPATDEGVSLSVLLRSRLSKEWPAAPDERSAPDPSARTD